MKKIILVLLIFLSTYNIVQTEELYKSYKNRVDYICKQYKGEKSIFQTTDYEKISSWDWISYAKKLYKENMNNIYKCAIISTKIKSINEIKDLIKQNTILTKKLKNKLDNRVKKLTLTAKALWKQWKKCWKINKNNNNPTQKLEVLKQATYELCKYHSYLEYLKEYNSIISNIVNEDWEKKDEVKSYNISNIIKIENEKKSEIDSEINRVYEIFSIAFNAYSQYETNIAIHLRLELIKDDYITYREKLHKVLNPINQVVYKIANAMKK